MISFLLSSWKEASKRTARKYVNIKNAVQLAIANNRNTSAAFLFSYFGNCNFKHNTANHHQGIREVNISHFL